MQKASKELSGERKLPKCGGCEGKVDVISFVVLVKNPHNKSRLGFVGLTWRLMLAA